MREVPIKFVRLVGAVLCWVLAAAALAAEGGFHFGVFPNMSARVMVENYQPLANYLGNALKQPVILESAPDFLTFHRRTLAKEYDVVLTAPHLAWLAWQEERYRPVLIYQEPVRGYLLVRAASPYQKLQDLKGKSLATPDPLAVVNIRMQEILKKAGLRWAQDLKVIEAGSHTNAATLVLQGQVEAAVVGVLPFKQLPKEVRDSLRPLVVTPPLPSLTYLVSPRVSAAQAESIRQLIEAFARTEAGQVFLQRGGFGSVRPLSKSELNGVEGDARELNRRLQAQAQLAGARP